MSIARDWVIHHYDSLPSTMDTAAALARLGARERTGVVAVEQTAGRGRGGRTWHSPRQAALYTTLILRPPVSPDRLPALSLIAAVAVSDAIKEVTGTQPRLKWPNDVWLGDDPEAGKVAGILLASSLANRRVDYALIGIGLNTGAPDVPLPQGATSLLRATDLSLTPNDLLAPLLAAIDRGYAAYVQHVGLPPLDAWRARAVMMGEEVTVVDGDRTLQGTLTDIDRDGALLLRDGDGVTHRVIAGDLTRGPRRQPGP